MEAPGTQAHVLAQVRVAGEHRRAPAEEALPQHLPEQGVELGQAGFRPHALAVRGIGHQQPLVAFTPRGAVGQLAALEMHPSGKARLLQVGERVADGARVLVIAADGAEALDPRRSAVLGLLQQAVPGGRVVLPPAEESPVSAQQTGSDVGGDQRALDRKRPRSAQGVEQDAAVRGDLGPARAQQDGGGEVLLERCRGALLPIPAPVQRLAREVQAQGRLALVQVGMDLQIRTLGAHVGAAAETLAETVGDGVLDLERTEAGVADLGAGAVELDREGATRVEVLLPGDGQSARVQRVGVAGVAAAERQQHPVGDPRPQADTVGVGQGAGEAHAAPGLGGVGESEAVDLVGKQGFEVACRGGEEGEAGHGAGL